MSIDPGERKLADLAEEQWADYKLRYQPIEYNYARRLTSERPGEKARTIASSVANAQRQSADNSMAIDRGLGISGLSPSSLRSQGAKNAMSNDMGGRAGMSAAGADLAMGDKKMAGILQAIQQGRGMASNSISGLTSSAISNAQNNALKQQVNDSIRASNWSTIGNLAGLAAGGAMHKWG